MEYEEEESKCCYERKVIPSSAIWAIRNAYPESDDTDTFHFKRQETKFVIDIYCDLCCDYEL